MGLILANLICFACHFKSIINIVCASKFFFFVILIQSFF
jgi:hypothetical protein